MGLALKHFLAILDKVQWRRTVTPVAYHDKIYQYHFFKSTAMKYKKLLHS